MYKLQIVDSPDNNKSVCSLMCSTDQMKGVTKMLNPIEKFKVANVHMKIPKIG